MELGKIQSQDELLIQAIIKMTCPLKLVELGYLNGYSTGIILNAMRDDATLVSYDNTTYSKTDDPRFTFKCLSQEDYEEDNIDFIFFDASHDLTLNQNTFKKVYPTLNEGAIIVVHDTGLWDKLIQDVGGKWIDCGYAHRPGEREFVNWLHDTYGLQTIHFHTLKETRHGITILQKYIKLDI